MAQLHLGLHLVHGSGVKLVHRLGPKVTSWSSNRGHSLSPSEERRVSLTTCWSRSSCTRRRQNRPTSGLSHKWLDRRPKVRQKRHPTCWAPNVIPASRGLDKRLFGSRNLQNLQKGLPMIGNIYRHAIHGQMTDLKKGTKIDPPNGVENHVGMAPVKVAP